MIPQMSEVPAQSAVPRRTQQRSAIVDVLTSAPGPLTPAEIQELASQAQEGLGLATVYRTLASLQQAGEVSTVHLPGEAARFELRDGHHRHHFRCESCDSVFALSQPCPVEVLEGVTLPGGFRVSGHALTLYGSCPACQPAGA